MNKYIPIGHLAEIIHKGKPLCVYIKEVKGKRIHVVLPTLKEELINHNDIIYIDTNKNNDSIEKIEERNKLRNKLKEIFNLQEIWEILGDEGKSGQTTKYDIKLIAELYLAKKPSDDEIAAFYRKIIETNNFFKIAESDKIERLTSKQVNEILNKQKKQQEKIEKQKELNQILIKLINFEKIQEQDQKWIEKLKDSLILKINDSIIEDTLKEKGLGDPSKLFEILVKNNLIDPDYFYEFHRLKFPSFSEEELIESLEISQKQISIPSSVDLTHLDTFTIDSEDTRDFDDAISVEFRENKIILYVHISNVSYYIHPESSLFKKALKRMQTLYLPDQIIPMLPPSLSEEKFSLRKDEVKDSVTFRFEISKNNLDIITFEPMISTIKVKHRFTYEYIDKLIDQNDEFWVWLYNLMMNYKNFRLQNGAISVKLPEIVIKVSENGELKINRIDMTPARDLVSEVMILTNYYTAKFMNENKVPIIYRSQREPSKIIQINNIVDMLNQLKHFNKIEFSLIPKFHSGLGLDLYTTVTSPIRRFLDLLAQNQLLSFITNSTYLSTDDILYMLEEIESNLQRAQYLQSTRNRYFLLKFLQNYKANVKGIVLETGKGKTKVYLPDFNIIGILKDNIKLSPNDTLEFEIKNVNPYNFDLELSLRR
ncbi:MAG: ribonuclease catalytic domain-containing protein [Candidatus Calescibacterium sp.]|nr:ribonuclease catalytic domain-containing protein [Candidatus Calescibacterium sp.]MDW8132878.1 ribonuclease catalytic domain-containing protein [Candidatus Calescibacterium sp.]